jgi:subtilisin family serine protease
MRRTIIRLIAALLLALLLAPLVATAAPPARTVPVDSAVLQQVAKGKTVSVWVIMRQQADLRPARAIRDWKARGSFVVERLQAAAKASQAGVLGALPAQAKAQQSFWIVNAVKVTADRATIDALKTRTDVAQIVADQEYRLPEPIPAVEQARIQSLEWGLERIGAPQVWQTFGVRGEGIVIANIDTGVQFDHPALVRQYRGNQGGGVFDHNYNWFDPSRVCGNPSLAPCDNNGHGTHTMGTMIGDDGDPGPNQIGVAPRARWIAAKGCESSSCSTSALLASGQWMLAPTDLSGNNPRPDLRPHIVNNSWGGGSADPFYQAIVQSWVAAGIFPAFANGNNGPSCGTVGSPGAYPESYGVGAFDSSNAIASFSSRGPSSFGGIGKPNIAAPGVAIRSSVPGSGYDSYSGTSMATPHLAGAVALLWSSAPALVGDIAATRDLLGQTAIDVEDLTCGGTPGNNNVWGEGRLDVLAAVRAAPRGPTGTLRGSVTSAASGQPISGANVRVAGAAARTTTTDGGGAFSLLLSTGSYSVTVSIFGFVTQSVPVSVSQGVTTTLNLALATAPAYGVSGVVRDSQGAAVANATVTLVGTPVPPATTNASGAYSFASVPAGEYDVQVTAGRCSEPQARHLAVSAPVAGFDVALPQRSDSFGYVCEVVPPSYIEAGTPLSLTGDDNSAEVSLPFPFRFYGSSYSLAFVSTNGNLNFLASSISYVNGPIPSASNPNGAIYPFWDDLFVESDSSVRTELLGAAPSRRFVIEWRNVAFFNNRSSRIDFEVVLYEDGRILTQYRNIDSSQKQGSSATIGIENADGTVAFQYASDQAVLGQPAYAVLYHTASSGVPVKFVCGNGTTTPGQSVYVVGNIPELGGWAPQNAVKLEPDGPYPAWTGVISGLPASTSIEWKCIKRAETGDTSTVIQWEPGANNVFSIPAAASASEPAGPTFGDFGGETVAALFVCENASTTPGQSVYVVGNINRSDGWAPQNAIRLTREGSSLRWSGIVNGVPRSTVLDWKCIKRQDSNPWSADEWQPGANNRITTPSANPPSPGYAGPTTGSF